MQVTPSLRTGGIAAAVPPPWAAHPPATQGQSAPLRGFGLPGAAFTPTGLSGQLHQQPLTQPTMPVLAAEAVLNIDFLLGSQGSNPVPETAAQVDAAAAAAGGASDGITRDMSTTPDITAPLAPLAPPLFEPLPESPQHVAPYLVRACVLCL